MLQQVIANRTGAIRWDTCFETLGSDAGHLAQLDGVLNAQHILVNLADEMTILLNGIREWLSRMVGEKISIVQQFCPAGWEYHKDNIMAYPEVVNQLLTNTNYPYISPATDNLHTWLAFSKELKKVGLPIAVDLVKSLKTAIELGTDTVCMSFTLNYINKSIVPVLSLPVRVSKVTQLLEKLKPKKFVLPVSIREELDKLMKDVSYPTPGAEPSAPVAPALVPADVPAPGLVLAKAEPQPTELLQVKIQVKVEWCGFFAYPRPLGRIA